MQFNWEFFENLNEIVYVADMDSHELIYMNTRLRQMLGLEGHEDYRGKQCYEVLQGQGAPCVFCSNNQLTEGTFYEWSYYNPLLKRSFLIKDTLVRRDGHTYRLEMAIDVDAQDPNGFYFSHSDSLIHQCLQQVYTTTDAEGALQTLLSFIGNQFHCHRSYIFERNPHNCFDNTHEWCAPGITPQIDVLQNEPAEGIQWWLDLFNEEKAVIIHDLESIREAHPMAYATLKPQEITALATGPIRQDGEIIGFFGVDNPDLALLPELTPLLHVMGQFIASLIQRRNLFRRLQDLSFHDALTGALNRNALEEFQSSPLQLSSLGALFCDITGLKQTNDSYGHDAGDELIVHCYQLIRHALDTKLIYRTGGDEFVALFPNFPQEEFLLKCQLLREKVGADYHHMALGHAWSDQCPLDIPSVIAQADQAMYQDKRGYYQSPRLTRTASPPLSPNLDFTGSTSPLAQFVSGNYFDPELLVQSLSLPNTPYYLYFGDLQTNQFYISDNMRDRFGFQSNLVYDLLHVWEHRICTPEDKALYRQDLAELIGEKKTRHDLRYQVRDRDGHHLWVHCRGLVKWNQDRSAPLFFSGCVSCQDNSFVVDSVTNFPREYVALSKLKELHQNHGTIPIIGFTLNNFTDINESKGRHTANVLMQRVASQLQEALGTHLFFYRLDGLRFMAVVSPGCPLPIPTLVRRIREIVATGYAQMDITVKTPCSCGVLTYPTHGESDQSILENTIALLSVAKATPGEEYLIHSPETTQKQREMAALALALSQDVLNGMRNFRVVVQPIVSAQDGVVRGGETLLRWRYQDQEVSPGIFIPMLEKSKLILPVGKWLFEQTVRICMRLIAYDPSLHLSFNVSYLQIQDGDFLDFIRQILAKYQLEGKHLIAELTEGHSDETPELLQTFVDGCKALGLQVALDDFGSGYSSLGLLLKYPANLIKLDRSLLHEITESMDNRRFIGSIVYACHQFGKLVCVEGVENQLEHAIVRDTGCDYIQGFFHHRPLEVRDLYQLLLGQGGRTSPSESPCLP